MLEGIRMIVLLVSLFLCAWIDWKTERVSVPLLLLGGMAAVLLHLFAQEESVFYLMTGMSVGIALLLYSLVTHESIGYGDGCLFVMTGLFLGIWENLVLLLLASVLAGIGSAELLFFLKKKKKCLTSTNSLDIVYDCCGERKQHGFLKRNSKNKKCLTRAESSDKLMNCCCE